MNLHGEFLVILLSFLGIVSLTISKYDFLIHLSIEFAIVFFFVVTYILIAILPKRLRTDQDIFLGVILLHVATFEYIHAVTYPGYYTSSLETSMLFWILARGTFSFGFLLYSVLIMNRIPKKIAYFLSNVRYTPVFMILLIAIIFPIVHSDFLYHGKTALSQTILGLFFTFLLFFSAYILRGKRTLVLSLLFSALSNLAHSYYSSNLYNYRSALGHSLLFVGTIALFCNILRTHVLTIHKQVNDLVHSYSVKVDSLAQEVKRTEKKLKVMDSFRKSLIELDNEIEISNLFSSFVSSIGLSDRESLTVCLENEVLYTNCRASTENLQVEKIGDITVYHNMEEEHLELVSAILPSLQFKIKSIRLQNELVKTIEALEEKDEYKTHFMRSISHEIKTPLSIILGNLQLVKMSVINSNPQAMSEALDSMERAIHKVTELVDNLLNLSRVEKGEMKVKVETVNVELFNEIIKEYREIAERKGLEFSFEFLGGNSFDTDYQLVSTILSNLLSNAIKYT